MEDVLKNNISLIRGDCLIEMKNIPDKSVDMVLSDIPYGTTACKWDVVIPFEPMWEQLKRITKDNGAICLFGSEPFSSHLRLSNLKMFKYDFYALKNKGLGCGFVHAKNQPIKTVETISVFSSGAIAHKGKNVKRMEYFPQGLIRAENLIKKRGPSSSGSFRLNIERPSHAEYCQEFTNYPDTQLDFKFNEGKRSHPTQKPVALLEYLIKTYTLENETVLDFTMGSGSTGVACKNLNRKFIGIEKDDKYFEIAKQRIENAKV